METGQPHAVLDQPIADLLSRMREGDRLAAAEFLSAYAPRIRRRVRGKLRPAMRRLFDSQEIVSTLGRRLDAFIRGGRLQASNEGELWSFIFTMVENAVIEKFRVIRSLQAKEGPDSDLARIMLHRLERGERLGQDHGLVELDAAFRALPDPLDREILGLWLNGMQLNHIAEHVDITAAAARKRWQRLREDLRARYDDGEL